MSLDAPVEDRFPVTSDADTREEKVSINVSNNNEPNSFWCCIDFVKLGLLIICGAY